MRQEEVSRLDAPRELARHDARGVSLEHRLVRFVRRERGLVHEHVGARGEPRHADGIARVPEQTQTPTRSIAPQHLFRVDPRPVFQLYGFAVLQTFIRRARGESQRGGFLDVHASRLVGLVDDVSETRHGVSQRGRANDDTALGASARPARVLRRFAVYGPERELNSAVARGVPRVDVLEARRGGGAVIGPPFAEKHATSAVGGDVHLSIEPARVGVRAGADARDAVSGRGELGDHERESQDGSRTRDGGSDEIADARRADDIQRLRVLAVHASRLRAAAAERADETGETEYVVAVHMRDEDARDLAVAKVRTHELVLRRLAAVKEPNLIRQPKRVRRDVARERGGTARRAQESELHAAEVTVGVLADLIAAGHALGGARVEQGPLEIPPGLGLGGGRGVRRGVRRGRVGGTRFRSLDEGEKAIHELGFLALGRGAASLELGAELRHLELDERRLVHGAAAGERVARAGGVGVRSGGARGEGTASSRRDRDDAPRRGRAEGGDRGRRRRGTRRGDGTRARRSS